MTSIVEVIQHYQRSIDSSQNNEARLLHCINKLYKLPIKVEHLQETGVGKTVNSLRKYNGEIGVAAKTLVTKWKAMVAAEEEPMDTGSQTNESVPHTDSNGEDGGTTPHDENHNRNNTSQQQEHKKHRSFEKNDKWNDTHNDQGSSSNNVHEEHSKQVASLDQHSSEKSLKRSNEKHTTSSSSSNSKDSHHKGSRSSSHKRKEREKDEKDHKSSKDKNKHRDDDKRQQHSDKQREEISKSDKKHDSERSSKSNSTSKEAECSNKYKSPSKSKERSKDEKSSSHISCSKDKSEHKSSTLKPATKESDSADRKRSRNSDTDSTDFKSPKPKVVKIQKSSRADSSSPNEAAEEGGADDGFDSSMGANFDDVLGMLNMPIKKNKKSSKSPSTPGNNSSSSKKDAKSHRSTSSNSGDRTSNDVANRVNASLSSSSSLSYSTPSSTKASTMKPDLLAPTAKLEPLDPSIVLELPTISTNYKPMPLNQTVMECVFNNPPNSSKPVRTLTDAEAITHGISSKTMRTKIYSGIRTGQTFQVLTLFDMCIRILQKNIDALEYTGGVPFEVLKPVLERATPQQLYVFEEYNPYLMEDSDVLWQQHVSRNFRTKKRLENESWREMFFRCQEEEESRLRVLKDSIKASQKIAAAPVRKTQLAFVDSMVKPPRNVLRKQEQYGTKVKLVATPASRVASLSNVTPNAAKIGDTRLRVAATVRDHAQVSSSSIRPKKAPLMQKTLQFIRGRHKR